jgi:hypothetical protein
LRAQAVDLDGERLAAEIDEASSVKSRFMRE